MMVRNEADILRVNLRHHLAAGIDRFLVVDNGSSDGSDQILQELSRDGRVKWTRDEGKYCQAEITTELAREAHAQCADWVITIDADEFWYAPGDNLRSVLEESSAGALEVQVTNFIQRRDQIRAEPAGLLYLTRRVPIPVGAEEWIQELVEKKQYSYLEVSFPPKWISRTANSLEIAMGNHGVSGVSPLERTDEIVCLHAPLRARSLLESKVEQGRRVAALGLEHKRGWHVQRWTRLAEQGEIDKEWPANSYANECVGVYGVEHQVVFDPRLRDVVRPWVAEAPQVEAHPSVRGRITDHFRTLSPVTHLAKLRRRGRELEELSQATRAEREALLRTIQLQLSAASKERSRAIETLTEQVIERDKMIGGLQNELHTKVGKCNEIIEDLQNELQSKVGQCNDVIKDLRSRLRAEVTKRDEVISDLQEKLRRQAGGEHES